jgi:tetratricopeptide (TPR) repeat protein
MVGAHRGCINMQWPHRTESYILDTNVVEAVGLHRQAKLEEASEAYQRILDNDPENTDVLNYFGMLEFQRGNTDRDIELAEGCLAVDSSHASGCNNLANMYLSIYRLDEAERYYLKSIDMDAQAVEPL